MTFIEPNSSFSMRIHTHTTFDSKQTYPHTHCVAIDLLRSMSFRNRTHNAHNLNTYNRIRKHNFNTTRVIKVPGYVGDGQSKAQHLFNVYIIFYVDRVCILYCIFYSGD